MSLNNVSLTRAESSEFNAAVATGSETAVRALWLKWCAEGKSAAHRNLCLVVAERVALKAARNAAGV